MIDAIYSKKVNQMNETLTAILFDIDGTLADSDPIHFEVFRDILSEEGFNEGKPIEYGIFI